VNPRLAGGFIPELVRLALGIDLNCAYGFRSSGKTASPSKDGESSRFDSLSATTPGRKFTGIAAEKRPSQLPGVQVSIYRKSGDQVQQQGDFRDRMGHVIAVGQTGSAARRAADAAHGHINYWCRTRIRTSRNAPCKTYQAKLAG